MSDLFAIVPFSSPNATGNQDYTDVAAFGGATPKAAMIIITGHSAADGASESTHARMGVQFTDGNGAHGFYTSTRSADNVGDTLTAWITNSPTGVIVRLLDPAAGNELTGVLGTFIANGLRVNWTEVDGSIDFDGVIVLFGGAGISVYAGSVNLGTGTSAIDVTDPGFEPDVVFTAGAAAAFGPSSGSFFRQIFGIAINDGADTQKCFCVSEAEAIAAGRPAATFQTAKVWAQQSGSGSGVDYTVTIGSFDASGFSVTPSANTGGDGLGYLAIKFSADTKFALWDFQTPTSTVAVVDTTPDFMPKLGVILGCSLESVDTGVFNSALAGGMQISAFEASESSSAAMRLKNNADPTDTASDFQAKALSIPSDSASGVVVATLTSFDDVGWTLNYSAVAATQKRAFALAIGERAPAPTAVFQPRNRSFTSQLIR